MTETSAPVAPAPPTQEELQAQLGVQIVDVSTGFEAARVDLAEENINQQTTVAEPAESKLGRFGQALASMPKKIWYGNVARDFIRQRHIRKGLHDEASQQAYSESMGVVVERFADETVALSRGETNAAIDSVEHGQELDVQLKSLISSFARDSSMSVEVLREERTRLLSEFGEKVHKDDRKKGIVFADNILEVAINARAAFRHGVGIDDIETALSAKAGEARTGARTEAKRDAVDNVIEKLGNSRFGSMINETTLAIGAGIVMSVTKTVARNGTMAAARVLGLGVGAGVLGGLRERLHIKQDRQLHGRQMAEGGEAGGRITGKRREQLEATRYETASASDLLLGLDSLHERLGAENVTSATLADAVSSLAHVDTRLKLSDELNSDFIAFDSKESLEEQRYALMKRVAELKVELQTAVDGLDDSQITSAGLVSRDVNETLDAMSSWTADIMNADVSEKDHAFQAVRRSRALKMGMVSFGTGVVFGTLIQETKAMFSADLQGVFEDASSKDDRRTMLASMFRHDKSAAGHLIDGHLDPQTVNEHGSAILPLGYKLVDADGGQVLIGADGKVVADHIQFGADGRLDEKTAFLLESKGIKLSETVKDFEVTHKETITIDRTPEEYRNAHPEQFTAVERELWYDNNTPGVFDRNELKLWWGADGVGVNADGNYVFNVSHMMPEGSFHGDQAANFQQLLESGQLKMAISTDRGSQNFVDLISFDSSGNAVIDSKSFTGQSAFATVDGHAQFVGGFAEAVQVTGQNAEGETTMRMLATVVGDNQPKTGTDTITEVFRETDHRVFTTFEAPRDIPVEVPPILPLYGRKGLETLTSPYESSGDLPVPYTGRSMESMRRWVAQTPERLRPRTMQRNPDGSAVWLEADGSLVVRDVERERQAIGGYIDSMEAEAPEYFETVKQIAESMTPMDKDCRVSVNVPAWLEAKQLGIFLEQYTQQVDASGAPLDDRVYEINILVNRRRGTPADDSVEVIQKFIEDYKSANGREPHINYHDIEVDPPHNNVGYIRKLLTDAVMIRSVARTEQNEPLYIETEDADLLRVDPKTVTNLISKLDTNPHLDAVRGRDDRAPEYLKDNDLLFLRRRIWDFSSTLARGKALRDPRNPNWNYMWNRVYLNGWNSGYSAEAYAMIGGYDEAIAGEDMIIGEKIAMMRGDGKYPNLEVVGTVGTRSDGSPRRFIIELRSGRDAYGADFSDEDKNVEMREKTLDELLETISKYERITPENVGAFNGLIKGYAKFVRTVTPGQAEANQMMKRVLFWLGFKKSDYDLTDDGTVAINDWSNVKQALDNYRERYDARTATT